ncbi:LytTR family DNA-binding domain-containing protein [Schleiferia thermophila]|uniref:LytR/AlgR family response regulator transcription factor n=1 Tax=Schleiferia thermophila TaxID=884107 RepID=UPI002FDB4751
MEVFKLLIVDDEQGIIESLSSKVLAVCNDVKIIGAASTIDQALSVIENHKPDIILLDIHLNDESGFELIQEMQLALDDYEPAIIFITAYDEYAIKAFRVNAVDYLLKPVDMDGLSAAIDKARKAKSTPLADLSKQLPQQIAAPLRVDDRIPVYTNEGIIFLNQEEIIRIETFKAHTIIIKTDGQKIESTKPIRFYDQMLQNTSLTRIHKSYIVNINYVRKYLPYSGGYLELNDGEVFSISSRKRESVLKKITSLYQ